MVRSASGAVTGMTVVSRLPLAGVGFAFTAQLPVQVGQARVVPGDQVPESANQFFPAQLRQRRQREDGYDHLLVKPAVVQYTCRRNQPDPEPDRVTLAARCPRLQRRDHGPFQDRAVRRRGDAHRDDGAFRDRSSCVVCPVSGGHFDRLRAALTVRVPFVPAMSDKHCLTRFLAHQPLLVADPASSIGSHRGPPGRVADSPDVLAPWRGLAAI